MTVLKMTVLDFLDEASKNKILQKLREETDPRGKDEVDEESQEQLEELQSIEDEETEKYEGAPKKPKRRVSKTLLAL